MNNDSISPTDSTPAQDRATDALLREFARLQAHDDEPFLAAFERQLAQESEPDAAPATVPLSSPMPVTSSSRRHRVFRIVAIGAAACALSVASWYLGYTTRAPQLVMVPQSMPAPENVAQKPESKPALAAARSTPVELSSGNGTSSKPIAVGDTMEMLDSLISKVPGSDKKDVAGLGSSDPKKDLATLWASQPGAVRAYDASGNIAAGKQLYSGDVSVSATTGRGDARKTNGSVTTLSGSTTFTGGITVNSGTVAFNAQHPSGLAPSTGESVASNLSTVNGVGSVHSNSTGAVTLSGTSGIAPLGGSYGARPLPRQQSGSLDIANGRTASAPTPSTLAGRTLTFGGAAVASSSVDGLISESGRFILETTGSLRRSDKSQTVADLDDVTKEYKALVTQVSAPKKEAPAPTTPANARAKQETPLNQMQTLERRLEELQKQRDQYFRNNKNESVAVSDPTSGNRYEAAPMNPFVSVQTEPLSTFSIDVDTASYANVRRILQGGGIVPPAAVRVEEMINYFPYAYPEPAGEHPLAVKVESAACPWNTAHRLVRIAMKARDVDRSRRAAANLVFLVDVSGSMSSEDRLPLVIKNLRVLASALNADDTVSIVTYAGHSGVALQPTHGDQKETILNKLASLSAGGSTNGAGGIMQAYELAKKQFIKEGINRVVLCTDGDFNVGITGKQSLVELVQDRAQAGIFLTVCGYGQGNLNDAMLEAITDKGNGVYHYIDSEREGRKVFQDDLLGTLVTVAKDVKLQIEFNPAQAAQYRLVGYDNRMLAKEDFANDKVDAGDLGAGHRVTAFYEVIPTSGGAAGSIPLKYQPNQPAPEPAKPASPELLTVKLRYKQPTETVSKLFDQPFTDDLKTKPSADFTFAATVAEFGNWLRGHRAADRTLEQLIEAAESARGDDPHGYRAEFIELMRRSNNGRR